MKKKIGYALICTALTVSVLAGCGKETASSTLLSEMPLVSSEEAPTAVSPEPADEAPIVDIAQAFSEDEVYAGISYVDALAAVRVEAGSGSVVNSVEKGAMPDGTEAWEINISPITESEDEINVVYYVHDDFCSALQ